MHRRIVDIPWAICVRHIEATFQHYQHATINQKRVDISPMPVQLRPSMAYCRPMQHPYNDFVMVFKTIFDFSYVVDSPITVMQWYLIVQYIGLPTIFSKSSCLNFIALSQLRVLTIVLCLLGGICHRPIEYKIDLGNKHANHEVSFVYAFQ